MNNFFLYKEDHNTIHKKTDNISEQCKLLLKEDADFPRGGNDLEESEINSSFERLKRNIHFDVNFILQ